jgi:hypothetical protein
MKILFSLLVSLFCNGIVFADDMQNEAIFFNNQNDVNMIVYYSTCYSYDSFWYGKNAQYCSDAYTTLHAKNNLLGPRFSKIAWTRTPGSNFEYVKINKITVSNFEGTHSLDFGYNNDNIAYTWYGSNQKHPALIFSIKKSVLLTTQAIF